MTDEPTPWDRLHGETPRAYMAFLTYRNMPGPRRSLRALHAEFYADRHCGRSVLANWSSVYHWVDRCSAWDRAEAERIADDNRQAIVEMNRRHAAVASAAIGKAVDKLTHLDSSTLGPRDLVALIDLGVRVERLARGEASTSVALAATVAAAEHRSSPTVADLDELVAAMIEAGAVSSIRRV